MLKLKTLKFKNIGRFVESQEISFEKLGNLVQVDAINNCTGGSSGSGKSTIFNALDFLLGLSDLSTAVLQSRLTKESISVEGHFDWDGKEVRVHRARKLSVTVDGVETVGSAKLAEEEIDKIIAMPRHLFRRILHRRQNEQGFFLNQTPAQMNAFLTDCLNLAPIRSKIDVIDLKLKELSQAKEKANTDLQAVKAALNATVEAQASLGQVPTTNVTDAIVESYKTQLADLESTLEALKGSNKREREEFQAKKPALDTIPYDRVQIDVLEAEIKSLETQINIELDKERARQVKINADISAIKLESNKQISVLKLKHSNKMGDAKTTIFNLSNMVGTGRTAKEKAIQLAAQLKTLRAGTCHTCLQSWQTDLTKTEEERLLKELSECKTDIEASVFASKEMEELKSALVVLNDRFNTEVAALTTKMNEETAVLSELGKSQQSPEFLAFKEKILDLSKQKTTEFVKEDEYKTAQNSRNQKLNDAFHTEHGTIIEKHRAVWESLSKEVGEAKSQYEQAAQALASHLIALNRYQDSLNSLKTKEEETNKKVANNNQRLVDISEKLEIAEEAKRCLKSYLSCSFDDTLESVSDRATHILRSVPTMANATIRLVGQKETGSGSVKEQVNALLDNDGEIDIDIRSLSGGERSALDWATDISVISLIEERTNMGINLVCLDEVFGGFDSISIEQALEMIKTLDKRVLITEHNSIAKEMISEKITVIRDGETSYIK